MEMVGSEAIRVLQLGSPNGLYGAERWILALAKNLGPSVTTWVGSINDGERGDVPLCVEAQHLGMATQVFDARPWVRAVAGLRKFVAANEVDIVHSHGYKTDFLAALACAGTQCKVVSTPHGWTEKPDWKLWVYELLDRKLFLKWVDVIAPLSEELYRSIIWSRGAKAKIRLIRNGVDTAEMETEIDVASELEALRNNKRFVIGYVGRLVEGKGLDILLTAVAKYGEPHWTIAIIGEGPERERLEDTAGELGIAERVMFFGFREDRLKFLRGFDVFVLPSRSEGIPRCLMEAMTLGVPVIASDIPGCRQLVDGVSTGLLFPPGEPAALSRAIQRFGNDHSFREACSMNGKRLIKERFSAGRMAGEYLTLYRELRQRGGLSH
jgi:glycosyltransferase involved in cell wall biosynthesis